MSTFPKGYFHKKFLDFFGGGNALFRYCQTKPHDQNEVGNKKGNITEDKLNYVVVTK